MNKDEFIKKQLAKFGCFTDNNVNIWYDDYEKVLQEPNINYDRLDEKIINEWDSTFTAPSTKWIREAKQDCIPRDERCQAVKDIQKMREEAAPPPPDVLAKIEAMRKKMRVK